jgi:ComF family protein
LPAWTGPLCEHCGLPFASPRAADAENPKCGDCRTETPAFDAARSYGLYTGKLRQVVLNVKFSRDERLGVHLGSLLGSVWTATTKFNDAGSPVIVPVPLHRSRQNERGFNQAELLAEGLARELGTQGSKVRIEKRALLRSRPTSPQTGLSVSARRENLRGAFEVSHPERIRGTDVVLIDDVMTTGATLSACARALKRAGAGRVWGLTLTRATPLFPDLTGSGRDNPVDEFGLPSP